MKTDDIIIYEQVESITLQRTSQLWWPLQLGRYTNQEMEALKLLVDTRTVLI